MLFDRFCGIVERQVSSLRKFAQDARIFTFDGAPHKFLPNDYPTEDREFVNENFFLPFRTIAVEDAASLIILHDTEPDMRGMSVQRIFIEFDPIKKSCDDVYDRKVDIRLGIDDRMIEKSRGAMMSIDPDMIAMHWGYIKCFLCPGGITMTEGWVEEAWLLSNNRVYDHISNDMMTAEKKFEWEMLRRTALTNAKVALMEVALANLPNNYIVEISHAKADLKRKKDVKIPRSGDRPIYILASPKEIRKRMQLSEPQSRAGRSPRPHERRAHVRTYRDARFVNLQGQTRIIPATWVGPNESVVGKRRYKVRLDL